LSEVRILDAQLYVVARLVAENVELNNQIRALTAQLEAVSNKA
jgi:hypothetical protein